MDAALQDVRLAFRQLARHRSFTAISLITLALGIGSTATFFSVLNAVAFRPLPFPEPDALVGIAGTQPTGNRVRVPYRDYERTTAVTSGLAATVAYRSRTITLSGRTAAAAQVLAAELSGDLFAVLGVSPQLGRSLDPSDRDQQVIVISNAVWTDTFGSDPDAVGKTVVVDGTVRTVVGIAPRDFTFPSDARAWLPLAAGSQDATVDVVARLRSGITIAQVDAALRTVPSEAPGQGSANWRLAASPLRDVILATKQRGAAVALLIASGLVLAVACANLAGLLMAYIGGRSHELAVRVAIGATRERMIRQLMTESGLIALGGGELGTIVAHWGVGLFIATLGKPVGASWMTFSVDARVLVFTLAVSMTTLMLFGLGPAIRGAGVDIRSVLQQDTRATSGRRSGRLRAVLVSAQLAVSLGLVASGASIVSSSITMAEVHPGFERDGLVVVSVPLSGPGYASPAQRGAFVETALERVRSIAGVSGAAAISDAPLVDRNVPQTNFVPEGWTGDARLPYGSFRFMDAEYVRVMRIPVRLGRSFTPAETRGESAVIVINETLSRRFWPNGDAVGRRIRLPDSANPLTWFTIVGVIGDVAQRKLPSEPENQMYFPPELPGRVALVIRADTDPAAIAATARDAVRTLDPEIAAIGRTMEGTYRAYALDRRQQGLVVAALSLIALLVAALGVFGVMSLMVADRRREIAIRMALGSSPAAVMRLVLGATMRLASAGMAAGLVLGLAATSFLSWIFFGLEPFDPRVFGTAAALLAGSALFASWWPARRASQVQPATIMKL